MFVKINHEAKVYINKIPFGDSSYSTPEKYCAVISLVPKLCSAQEADDFDFINNIDVRNCSDYLKEANDTKVREELYDELLLTVSPNLERS